MTEPFDFLFPMLLVLAFLMAFGAFIFSAAYQLGEDHGHESGLRKGDAEGASRMRDLARERRESEARLQRALDSERETRHALELRLQALSTGIGETEEPEVIDQTISRGDPAFPNISGN